MNQRSTTPFPALSCDAASRGLAIALLASVTVLGACAGNTEIEPPPDKTHQETHEISPNDPPSSSSSLYMASRDGSFFVVRVEAAASGVAALSAALPKGFVPEKWYASDDQSRFVALGKAGEHEEIWAGTRTEWKRIAEGEGGESFLLDQVSPGLELLNTIRFTEAGGLLKNPVVRFDGTLIQDLDALPIVTSIRLGRTFFAAPALNTESMSWAIYGDDGQMRRLVPAEKSDRSWSVVLDDALLLLENKTCHLYSASNPDVEADTFPCDSLIPPFVLDGSRVMRMDRAGRRSLVTELPAIPSGELLHNAGDLSAFIDLREPDFAATITFVRKDGSRALYDPGNAADHAWLAEWTRVAGAGGVICALVSFDDCSVAYQETCTKNIVDLVCSDGNDLRRKRFHRDTGSSESSPEKLGPRAFSITPDAKFILFRDGPELHRVDTTTFAELILDTPYAMGARDGDLPTELGRAMY